MTDELQAPRHLHVMMLSLDAVSRARFVRDLPLTDAFLRLLNGEEVDFGTTDPGVHAFKVKTRFCSPCHASGQVPGYRVFNFSRHAVIGYSTIEVFTTVMTGHQYSQYDK